MIPLRPLRVDDSTLIFPVCKPFLPSKRQIARQMHGFSTKAQVRRLMYRRYNFIKRLSWGFSFRDRPAYDNMRRTVFKGLHGGGNAALVALFGADGTYARRDDVCARPQDLT